MEKKETAYQKMKRLHRAFCLKGTETAKSQAEKAEASYIASADKKGKDKKEIKKTVEASRSCKTKKKK